MEELRITNPTVIAVTGVRIDGVDIGLQLKPADMKSVPMTWEPGIHTYSIRFTPPDVKGAASLWTKPRDFEMAADARKRHLVINEIVLKERIAKEQLSNWTAYRFEQCKYSVDLPSEPSVKLQGRSVLAGGAGVSFKIICDETRLQKIDTERGSAEQIEKNGFPGFFERSSDGDRVVHRLKVLAHGNIYHLVMEGSAEEMEEYSGNFFDSFTIDRE